MTLIVDEGTDRELLIRRELDFRGQNAEPLERVRLRFENNQLVSEEVL